MKFRQHIPYGMSQLKIIRISCLSAELWDFMVTAHTDGLTLTKLSSNRICFTLFLQIENEKPTHLFCNVCEKVIRKQ